MEGGTAAQVLCCQCGCSILANPSMMCAQCLSTRVDITEGIATQLSVHRCRACERWLKPGWVTADLESNELMALCLKKIKGLSKVNLVDAQWIWTEPHSMRLKVKLTIQKEVEGGTILQQSFVTEFVIRNQQCDACQKQYTDGTWKAVVQVRQRVDHKRTFYYLEQLLLKHNVHSKCLSIQSFRDGMDFYFTERNEGVRFCDFLQTVTPTHIKSTKKLISADNHSNIFNFKFTYLATIIPICKDDLLALPAKLSRNLSDISPLVLVERISNLVHVVDPVTCDRATFDIDHYTKACGTVDRGFSAIMSAKRLVEYIVLGVEPILAEQRAGAASKAFKTKTRLASVEVARSDDFGVNDKRFHTISHLGHILRAGDTVLGYDLASANLDEDVEARVSKRKALEDVLLVRKLYGLAVTERKWGLRKLQVDEEEEVTRKGKAADMEIERREQEYEQFMQQLEGDKEMRRNVNLYKMDGSAAEQQDDEDVDEEQVKLDELMEGLIIDRAVDDEEDLRYLRGEQFEPQESPEANRALEEGNAFAQQAAAKPFSFL